jgi:hypothetical protein
VLTLASGIGATLTIFSIFEGVLMRPMPFPESDRLVILGNAPEGVPLDRSAHHVTAPAVGIYSHATDVFSAMGAYPTLLNANMIAEERCAAPGSSIFSSPLAPRTCTGSQTRSITPIA